MWPICEKCGKEKVIGGEGSYCAYCDNKIESWSCPFCKEKDKIIKDLQKEIENLMYHGLV